MGVLDEAIRQHLELKRAHGASEDELQRQEAEALGPARREPAARPAQEEDDAILDEAGAGDPHLGADRPVVGADAPVEDAEPDEVMADESLDTGPAEPGETGTGAQQPRVFDVEELGPPDEPARAPGSGSTLAPVPEPEPELADVVPLEAADAEEEEALDADEELLDAEEEAEEELAEELAGAEPAPGPAPEPPPPAVADAPITREPASFDDDTIYHPPPTAAPADAETDEYELEDEPVEGNSVVEGAAVGEVDEEEELLELEEEEDLDDDLDPEEAGPPPDEHLAADEDLDFEDDLDAEGEAAPPADPKPPGSGAPPAGPAAAGGEDVLEETPEFLEEAPDHERLWFEQKPPRDFDLDR